MPWNLRNVQRMFHNDYRHFLFRQLQRTDKNASDDVLWLFTILRALFARGGGGGVGILWEQKFRIARAKKSIASHGLRKNRDPISLLIEHEKTINRLWNGWFPSIHKCGFLSIYGQYLMGKCTRLSSKILLFLGSFFPTNRVCFRKAPKDSRYSGDSRPEHKGG